MVCNEIVYKNENKSNCITNDTGFLTVPTSSASQLSKNRYTDTGATFEIELDYYSAIEKEIEKFDQHLNAYIASTLEKKIIEKITISNKQECAQCIHVLEENVKFEDDLIAANSYRKPCESTVNIIKSCNEVFSLLEHQNISVDSGTHDKILRTIMYCLEIDELYSQSNFDCHVEDPRESFQHKNAFIRKVVHGYMIMKAKNIGNRISEAEQGAYIRHNNKKRVQEAGQ